MKNYEKLLQREALTFLVLLGKSYVNIAKAAHLETASQILEGVEYAERVLTDLINTEGEQYS